MLITLGRPTRIRSPVRLQQTVSSVRNSGASRLYSVPQPDRCPTPRSRHPPAPRRGRVRGRAAPYCVAELAAGPGALSTLPPQPGLDGPPGAGKQGIPQPLSGPCRRGWFRNAASSRRLQQRRGSQPETRTGDDDPHRLLQQLVLSGNLIKEAVRRLHSRGLQLHAKLPQRPPPGPLSAPAHEPPSPRSPRPACSDPGVSGRRAQLRTGDGMLVPGS
ncbi:PREDICTED: proto-oncogene FRAT1 [Dipodomys ordii]|uniref:Proto-oncogene FRAT1 n=1 Tax=Dipodomys ordii TaxID=10020 RepID=A0A1S3F9T7_DIPOR|nr:PREDICTED: proto-oncogene FRAT1 [Dipodomys ordii]